MVCAWNPSPQIVESRGLKIQDHPQLYDKFKTSWGYIRLSLKNSNINTNFSFVKMINTSGIKRIALALCVLFPRMGVLTGIQTPALSPSWTDPSTPLLLCSHLGVTPLLTLLSPCPRGRNWCKKNIYCVKSTSACGWASLCEDAVCDSLGAFSTSFPSREL